MASVSKRPNGRRRVHFTGLNGKRQTIYLGKISQRQAERFCKRVEDLLACRLMGEPVDYDTAEWVGKLAPGMHSKLAACGLATLRQVRTLGDLVRDFRKSINVATTTCRHIRVVTDNLLSCFGKDRELLSITKADAREFRTWLAKSGDVKGGPLALTTVSRRVRRVKQVFKHAVDREWLKKSPFADQAGWNETNQEAYFDISRPLIDRILAEISDPAFRAIVCLARFGGLRCPSEVLPLEWTAVNWKTLALTVKAVKTGVIRPVPLFPEVHDALNPLWEAAAEGETLIFPGHQMSGAALTKKLRKACEAAGVNLWRRPWQNMRATRVTELLEEYPIQTVAAWLGHSPKVALDHYAQVVKEHHASAIDLDKRRIRRSTPKEGNANSNAPDSAV